MVSFHFFVIEVQNIVPTMEELTHKLEKNNFQMTEKLKTDLIQCGTEIMNTKRKGTIILLFLHMRGWLMLICIFQKNLTLSFSITTPSGEYSYQFLNHSSNINSMDSLSNC